MADTPITIQHLPSAGRFEAVVDGLTCHLDYRRQGDTLIAHHTEVPHSLAGRGIAAALVQALFDFVAEHNLRVEPQCSYVQAWARRHPHVTPLLSGSGA